MKKFATASMALIFLCTSSAIAQQPPAKKTPLPAASTVQPPAPSVTLQTPHATGATTIPSLSLPAVTPEVWLYSQEVRRHDDPAQAVRRKAEAKSDQRMQRIAAMKWYGFSNARPQAAVTPFTSTYSPAWIGNGYNRYDWMGATYPTTALWIDNYIIQR